jgi:hypothetical protein
MLIEHSATGSLMMMMMVVVVGMVMIGMVVS